MTLSLSPSSALDIAVEEYILHGIHKATEAKDLCVV